MNLKASELSKIKEQYLKFLKSKEVKGKRFKDKIGQLNNFYIPICDYIHKKYKNKTLIVGLSGGQGAGKTTIAEIIKIILKGKYNLETINFSIDELLEFFSFCVDTFLLSLPIKSSMEVSLERFISSPIFLGDGSFP